VCRYDIGVELDAPPFKTEHPSYLAALCTLDTRIYDTLIIGAGLSGIGAACRFKTAFPDDSFTIIESREAIGGTWDLFRYPGIRSDSDMLTLGYEFRPWVGDKFLADGRRDSDCAGAFYYVSGGLL